MEELTPSDAPEGLVIEAVEWLPSAARSGLVRVRGRWETGSAPAPGLPVLLISVAETVHRFASLPDPRGDREPTSWRGAYVVNSDLLDSARDALSLEFPGGATVRLPEPAGEPAAPGVAARPDPEPPEPAGGDVIDRAVLAERRARRAEASQEAQAKISREAMSAVEVLELRAAQLEVQLDAITTERNTLARQAAEAVPPHEIDALQDRLAAQESVVAGLEMELADARDALARAATPPALPPAPVPAPAPAPADGELAARAAAAEQRAVRLRDALTAAVTTISELRGSLREARLQRRTADVSRTANAVRLVVAEAERAEFSTQLATARDDLRMAHAVAAEAHRLAQGAEAAHDETRRRFTERVAALEAARQQISALEREVSTARETVAAEQERTRAQAERREAELQAEVEARVAARNAELVAGFEARSAELEAGFEARSAELAAGFEAREAGLDARLEALQAELDGRRGALEDQLATERSGWESSEAALLVRLEAAESALAGALTERDIAEATAAAADTERRATSVARAAMAEQAARAGGDPAATVRLERRLIAEREAREAEHRALEFERAKLAELTDELASERERIRTLEAQLAEALAAAVDETAGIEEVAPAPAVDETAGIEEVAPPPAAFAKTAVDEEVSVPPPVSVDPLQPDRAQVVADLDRAAAALRERADVQAEVAIEAPARPTIVSATTHPPRELLMGKAGRDYPPLRGALVRFAHDDPSAAARLIVGLLGAQWRSLDRPLDYDLTLGDGPTYRVETAVARATVTEIAEPRPRGESDFHASFDVVTAAEILAGVMKIRRFGAPRVAWGRRSARSLNAIGRSQASLAEVVRDGADLDPALVLRCLEYAVPTSWTRGHDFTIEEHIVGPEREDVVYITSRDGRGLTVATSHPGGEPDAIVVVTRAAFAALLRGETPSQGERPAVRGDYDAVDTLREWTDRVRSGGEG